MTLRTALAAAICACLFTSFSYAQHQAEVNLMGAFPQGEFKDKIDNGFGISGGYTYGFGNVSPIRLRVGGDVGYIVYGRETRTEPFSTFIPDVFVDVETMNNIVQYGLVAKLSSEEGAIRPYIQGRAGFSYFYTETTIKNQNKKDDDDEIASSKNLSDTTTYASFGGGFLIPVWQQTDASKGKLTVSIDLRFQYVWGNTAQYLKKGSIRRDTDTGKVAYDIQESKTDMSSLHVGVAVGF